MFAAALLFFAGLSAGGSTPIPPSKDPWYAAPMRFESASPGDVFKVRRAPGNLTAMYNSSAVYNILFRTTDSLYQPSWAVTTLYLPPGDPSRPAPHSAAPFLTWLHPYDSNYIDASPSFLFHQPTVPFVQDLPAALARGWWVSVPDYEGPKASFTAGVTSGHAVLDSVRAVQAAGLGINKRNPAALWGYSGGGLAAEWAAELHAGYAPELNLAGVAIGSPVVNVSNVLYNVNRKPLAGLIPPSLLGLTSQYPDAEKYLVSRLKPETKAAFLAARTQSWTESIQAFSGQDIGAYFVGGLADVFAPEMRLVWGRETYMGHHGVPWMPVYVYQAVHDEIATIDYTAALVENFCRVGSNVVFQKNTAGGHLEELAAGAPGAVRWLTSIFDGTYEQKYLSIGCSIFET
ncbi:lipase [Lasiosphaeria hispida]|uniref:Lipase n=1 Tax=Lasiosphaeria hispida TaxID=260671 RepID=A0AAJ0HET4_9PEZI|nr:lipase [Lasiosphaeria hispida]